MEAARSAASFMDGCVVAVQVEDLGLPKSAVGTVGQTSKMFSILTLDFQAVRSRIWESPDLGQAVLIFGNPGRVKNYEALPNGD